MPRSRLIQRIAGDPEKVAWRLAVRLRYLGDQIQVVSATEFIHAPQPAERLLFCCPRHVRVVVLPADEPGHCLLVLEPRHESWWQWRWPARLATAACTALAAWLLRDGPFLA
ncbi:MAG: hypothetical protein HUU35_08370, partial [Armatimonadetes bacterium]|nr:hypothetical protein [Armatimonadota bacterium]